MIFEKLQLKQWPSVHHIRIKKTLIPTSDSFLAHLTSFKYYFLLKTTFKTKIAKNHRQNWPKNGKFCPCSN